jgi:hypothetical protein
MCCVFGSGLLPARRSLEFDELVRVMRQVEPLFIGYGSYSSLLHGQRAEQYLDRRAVLILADFVYHQRVG